MGNRQDQTVDGSGGGQFVSNSTGVFLNQVANDNRYLQLQVSTPNNRFGVGVQTRVLGPDNGELLGFDELRTDFCYRSKRDARLHFGVGSRETVDVTLGLPAGQTKTLKNLKTDARYAVWMRDWRWDQEEDSLHIYLDKRDVLRLDGELASELDGQSLGQGSFVPSSSSDVVEWVLPLNGVAPTAKSELYTSNGGLAFILLPQRVLTEKL